MPHFLIEKEEIKGRFVELIDKETFLHITKALRMKEKEKIKFIDKNEFVYNCEIETIEKNSLRAKILSKEKSLRKLKRPLSLIQSILMTEGQNQLVANATQSGVSEIYPVISDRSAVNFKLAKDRVSKWQKIAQENFKQCERADIPTVFEVSPLIETILKFKKQNVLIFVEKNENTTLKEAIKKLDENESEKIAVVIGPEGGFSQDEFDFFKKNAYAMVSLGPLIYKAQNAVTAAISNIISRF